MRHVLFICEGNQHRSPTAERLYGTTADLETRSAGLSDMSRVQVTDELVAWADVIFVMEKRLHRMFQWRFSTAIGAREVICLNVPDDFQRFQAELVALLTEKLIPFLGPPQGPGTAK
jgi:predicted protein tyrosine phosphatase